MGFWVARFLAEGRQRILKSGFNFDLPSDEEAEESSDSREPGTPAGVPSHSSSSDA